MNWRIPFPPPLPFSIRRFVRADAEGVEKAISRAFLMKTGINSLVCAAMAAGLAVGPAWSQVAPAKPPGLAPLKAQYEARKLELEAGGASQVSDLSTKYAAALDNLITQKTASGDLDAVIAIRAEKAALADPLKLPKLAGAPPELDRFRATFTENRDEIFKSIAKSVAELNTRYAAGLAQLEVQLTKSGSVDEALAVRGEKERIEVILGNASNAGVPRAPLGKSDPILAQMIVEGTFRELKEGEMIYSNRGYTWADVPRKFSGWDIQHRPGASVTQVAFEVRTPGVVFAMVDKVNLDKLKADGWKEVEECGSLTPGRDVFIIMEKPFEAGKHSFEALGFLGARLMRPKAAP